MSGGESGSTYEPDLEAEKEDKGTLPLTPNLHVPQGNTEQHVSHANSQTYVATRINSYLNG